MWWILPRKTKKKTVCSASDFDVLKKDQVCLSKLFIHLCYKLYEKIIS